MLAVTAVVTGLCLAVLELVSGRGGLLVGLRSAGWIMTSLPSVLLVGALAAVALVSATLTIRSRAAAVGVVGVVGVSLVQALLVTGSPRLALFVGVPNLRHRVGFAHLGGLVVTLGIWDALAVVGVASLDVWVLPPAVHLFVAADEARRAGTASSSWFVDVPPVLLVGGAAVLERLATGGGRHALLAGVVAVAAVVHGAVGRHAGPLVVGTLLLLTVVGVEVFAAVVAVPTWAWLTCGGLVLFGAAALVERAQRTPVRAARRLLDVVGERFD